MNTHSGAPDLVRTAARNNAELCALVCAAHDVGGTFAPDAWSSERRTPDFYPDAVTLDRDVDATALLARIDDSSGASVKDSFATLDLSGFGFRVLFDAQWFCRPSAVADAPRAVAEVRWSVVDDPGALKLWEEAWSEDGTLARPVLGPPVGVAGDRLPRADVSGDDIVAGAIVNRSRGAVGISNVFFLTGAPTGAWAGLVGEIDTRFPGLPTVGYEPEGLLGGARRAGFRTIGPLRVWIKD